MTKNNFIGQYLDKKMKNHNLPMGLEYYNKLSKHTDEAEKKWEKIRIEKMLMKLPVVYDWIYYEGERVFIAINYEATKKAKRPMIDIHYCATAALNNRVEKTVQWNKKKFKLIQDFKVV